MRKKRKREGRIGVQEGEGRYEANPSFLFQGLIRRRRDEGLAAVARLDKAGAGS
jgi:hypothetical protein